MGKEYIEREALIEEINSLSITLSGKELFGELAKFCVVQKIDEAPTADVVEVVHGEWLKSEWGYPDRTLTCSLCGFQYDSADYKTPKFNQKVLPYCPHCGARMDGGKHGN